MLPTGQGGGASHQRGKAFPRPQGGCMVFPRAKARLYGFRRQRRHKKWRPWGRRTFPAERYFIPPEGGALNPSGRRQPVPDRTLGAQGQRPGGWLNPHARKGVSTFGNTGKHRPGPGPDPDPDRAERRLNPHARQGLSLKAVNPFGPGPLSSSFSSTTGTPALTRASASTPLPLIFFPLKVPS